MTSLELQTKSVNSKKARTGNKPKTIKAPGTKTERIAQACDRCRAKKTKCDGKVPSCSNCAAVGLECIVSDKLSRRAFPKGYTETLEERIRQLEAENKKLLGLVDLKDDQIKTLSGSIMGESIKVEEKQKHLNDSEHSISQGVDSIFQQETSSHVHNHEKGCPCGCSHSGDAVHERPVSIAGSVYEAQTGDFTLPSSINLSDDESLLSDDDLLTTYSRSNSILKNGNRNFSDHNREVSPAPGAFAAATAIARMQNVPLSVEEKEARIKQNLKLKLTSLVAISIPRSTEETLFIPTLLSKLCQEFGYESKPAALAALSLASLKETVKSHAEVSKCKEAASKEDLLLRLIMNRTDVDKLPLSESIYLVKELISLPKSRIQMDQLLTLYFQEWGNMLPILNKKTFLDGYMILSSILELDDNNSPFDGHSSSELLEKFAAIMVLVISLAMLLGKNESINHFGEDQGQASPTYNSILNRYDFLIHEFIKPNCLITKSCSIQSLQILSLALLYCHVIGDTTTCYEVRGRVISMAQQLRLHRCPAAVLGLSGSRGNVNLQNLMQGERRILFWCIYCLDIYSSLNLGVPRLLKDFEIECASPFAGKNDDENDDNENILVVNNTKLTIVGKVSQMALSFILYCKVLGRILDCIFSRYDVNHDYKKALEHERMLECWRRDLFSKLKFETDINELSFRGVNGTDYESGLSHYSKLQLTLIFMYYHAKMLIYSPVISKYGNHQDVGLLMKESLLKGNEDVSKIVSSISLIQLSSIRILEILCYSSKTSFTSIPVPLNIYRQQARSALLVAKGVLDYMKGGPLYQNLKTLLLDTISCLNNDSNFQVPGSLTKNSARLLNVAVFSILGINLTKTTVPPKRKQAFTSTPITKMAVSREPVALLDKQQYKLHPNLGNFIKPDSHQAMQDGNYSSSSSSKGDTAGIFNQVASSSIACNNESTSASNDEEDYIGFRPGADFVDTNDGLESMLHFDPFQMDFSHHLLMNEFVADGSLGLVPYLDITSNLHESQSVQTNSSSLDTFQTDF